MSLKNIAASRPARIRGKKETHEPKAKRIEREGAPATPKEMANRAAEAEEHRRRYNVIAMIRERQHNLAKAFKNAKAWGAGDQFIKAQERRERRDKLRTFNIRWSNYNNPCHPDFMDTSAYLRMLQS